MPLSQHRVGYPHSQCIMVVLVILMMGSDVSGFDCNLAYECVGQSLPSDPSDALSSAGYKANSGGTTDITIDWDTQDNIVINCAASFSCANIGYITGSATDTSHPHSSFLQCAGVFGCANAIVNLTGNVNRLCLGSNSCNGVTFNAPSKFSSSEAGEMRCSGDRSCANAEFHNHKAISAFASYALYNATIHSVPGETLYVYLYASNAGSGARIFCHLGHSCTINCYVTACHMLYIDCVGSCTIQMNSVDTVRPITDYNLFDNSQLNILYDSSALARSNDDACVLESDDYPGLYRYITISGSNICCRGRYGCVGSKIQSTTSVVCSGELSCSRSDNITAIDAIFCSTHWGCQLSTLHSNDVYCLAENACDKATITASNLYCSGLFGCIRATILNTETVYFSGRSSGYLAAIDCTGIAFCSIICSGYDSCGSIASIQCNECSVSCDRDTGCPLNFTSAPSAFTLAPTLKPTYAPTSITLTPTLPPTSTTTSPTGTPTRIPSATPTREPSESPTFLTDEPTRIPSTAAPTQIPSTDPSKYPTDAPTRIPSSPPTRIPSMTPTRVPSATPTRVPSAAPTRMPSTSTPSSDPSQHPTDAPTADPSSTGTNAPTTDSPTIHPTGVATTDIPSANPKAVLLNEAMLDTKDLEETYRTVSITLGSSFGIIALAAWSDSTFIRSNDYLKTGRILATEIQILDMLSDCFFAVNIGIQNRIDSACLVPLVFTICFIVIPVLATILELHFHCHKHWLHSSEQVDGWLRKNDKIMYGLSILTGSSFSAIALLNSYVFQLGICDMGLTEKQLMAFMCKRVRTVVLLENVPQLALQIWFLVYSDGLGDPITITSIVLSVVSILISGLSMFTQQKLSETVGYVAISMKITGHAVASETNRRKCKTLKRVLAQELAALVGVHESAVEVIKPVQIKQGFALNVHFYFSSDSAKPMVEYRKILSDANETYALQELFVESWKLSAKPDIGDIERVVVQSNATETELQLTKYAMETTSGVATETQLTFSS
eukprot:488508_1